MRDPLTIDTPDSDGMKIDAYEKDIIGRDYVHVKTGGVYTVTDIIWDADTDHWAILYRRKDGQGCKFKRLLKNFYWKDKDVPRFVKLEYGEQKPVPRGDNGKHF